MNNTQRVAYALKCGDCDSGGKMMLAKDFRKEGFECPDCGSTVYYGIDEIPV
jgi:predicted RNA-binding Zn-ribbon protein involved in translation (DUF1610 family)